jgi:hypothetical protein
MLRIFRTFHPEASLPMCSRAKVATFDWVVLQNSGSNPRFSLARHRGALQNEQWVSLPLRVFRSKLIGEVL